MWPWLLLNDKQIKGWELSAFGSCSAELSVWGPESVAQQLQKTWTTEELFLCERKTPSQSSAKARTLLRREENHCQSPQSRDAFVKLIKWIYNKVQTTGRTQEEEGQIRTKKKKKTASPVWKWNTLESWKKKINLYQNDIKRRGTEGMEQLMICWTPHHPSHMLKEGLEPDR